MKAKLLYLEENFEEILMVLLLIAMTVIMGIQVFARYVLGSALSWSEEITRYLFIWSAFLSVSLCTKKCISIKIDQFINKFPNRGIALFKIVNLTISFIFFVYLIPFAYRYLMSTIASGQVSPACGIPMAWVQSAPLVCFSLTAIRLVQRWVLNWKIVFGKREGQLPEDTLAGVITEAVTDAEHLTPEHWDALKKDHSEDSSEEVK